MNQKEIHDLIKLINKTDISEFKLRDKDFSLTIRTKDHNSSTASGNSVMPIIQAAPAPQAVTVAAPAPEPAPAAAPAAKAPAAASDAESDDAGSGKFVEFKSPMVGTFYRKPAPDKEVFVQVGDKVKKGDVLCVIEAMKLFNEVECEMDGTIAKVLLEDASPVEYDQPLFLIDPA